MNAHPYADLFPLMADDELRRLADDIAANGQREPIYTVGDLILDGRNRERACKLAEVMPRYAEYEGDDPLGFVISKNLHRRHLTESQRAMVAARVANMRQGERTDLEPSANLPKVAAPVSQAKAAEMLNVGERTVRDAKKVVTSGAPELVKAVESGEVSASAAAAIADESVEDQQEIVARGEAEIIARGKELLAKKRQAQQEERKARRLAELEAKAAASPAGPANWSVVAGDCVDVLGTLTEPPRLIFADPPYNIAYDGYDHKGDGGKNDDLSPEDYLAWVESWVSASAAALAADGSFWLLISDEFAAEACLIVKRHFTLRSWVIWYETFGVNCSDKFNRTKRHLFYAVRDPKRFVFNADAVSRPSDRQLKYDDPRANPDGKILDDVWLDIPRLVGTAAERIPDFPTQLPLSLLRRVVGCCTDPGDLVFDPFTGSGTTGAAAVALGRRFVGSELRERFASLASLRLKGVASETG